jgi:hypothetical protein
MPDANAAAARDDAARVIFQGGGGGQPRRAQRRRDAKEQARDHTNGNRKPEHAPIEREIEKDDVGPRGDELHERAAGPNREEHAARGPEGRQHEAFNQQLSRDLPARSAKRETHGQFLLSPSASKNRALTYRPVAGRASPPAFKLKRALPDASTAPKKS